MLAGTPRLLLAERDVVGRPITDTAEILSPGVAGSDIRLTIDTTLQLAAEQEVLAAYTADRAVSVSAVVMDPKTGAIMAMASYPSYDANAYRTIAAEDPSVFIDPIVSSVYEPGSVFKMLTAEAALEQGTINLSTPILDSGSLSLDHGENRIYDADRTGMGYLAARDIVAFSRNVGAAKIALGLGKSTAKAAKILPAPGPASALGQDRRRPRRRGTGTGARPRAQALEPGRPGQRLVRPGRGRHPAPAGDRLRGDGQRRHAGHAPRRARRRRPGPGARGSRPGHDGGDEQDADRPDEPRGPHRALVRREDAHQGLRRRRQDRDRPDLGSQGEQGPRRLETNRYNYSFVGYVGRGSPELVIAVTIHEAKPLAISQGNLPLAVESYELFRRLATDAMSMLDLPKPGLQSDR